jgi:hypothetical protein
MVQKLAFVHAVCVTVNRWSMNISRCIKNIYGCKKNASLGKWLSYRQVLMSIHTGLNMLKPALPSGV